MKIINDHINESPQDDPRVFKTDDPTDPDEQPNNNTLRSIIPLMLKLLDWEMQKLFANNIL